MTESDFFHSFMPLLDCGDLVAAMNVVDHYPGIYSNQSAMFCVMKACCMEGNIDFVNELLARGFDVNVVDPDAFFPDRAIVYAVTAGAVELVRFLVSNGSDINWGRPDHPAACVPLFHAIHRGGFEIIKVLVEAGGYLNVIDKTAQTPLDWVMGLGMKDAADYLRSKGALTAAEVRAKQGDF